MLNILLFFVFATELAVSNSLNVAVPQTEYGESAAKDNDALLIEVTKENKYFINGEEIAVGELPVQMRLRKQANPLFESVIVRGDLGSRLQATVDVLGACKQAGIAKVRIETEKPYVDRNL
ncbi:biopolymer transporter ExbD [Methylocapsa polymorpha]|uniref:Biopolymer transporter ExbD n=1 Tax=Methylocapsa polymorpha TaxID=3080828 RepID=A0ABZ0HSU7_9HYPH|nr:biopolymer transporter ExbD [Methylocapsa sp. RX1]